MFTNQSVYQHPACKSWVLVCWWWRSD